MTHPARAGLTLLAVLALGACAQSSRPRASAAVVQACRQEVDRVYAAQNRVDLSVRDNRDIPFASSYNSGITSRGLGAQFGRDNQTQACITEATNGARAPAGAVASTGPTFGTTSATTSK